jgi:hypothetical protein
MLALYASDSKYYDPDRGAFLKDVLHQFDSSFTGHQTPEHGKGFLPYIKRSTEIKLQPCWAMNRGESHRRIVHQTDEMRTTPTLNIAAIYNNLDRV